MSITDLSPAAIRGRVEAAARRGPISADARRAATAVFDVLVIIFVAGAALLGRRLIPHAQEDTTLADRALAFTPWIAMGWFVLLLVCGTYQERVLSVGVDEYQRVLTASGVTAGGLAIYLYLANAQLSRAFYLLLFGLGVPAILVGRRILRFIEHQAHKAGHWRRQVLLVGSSSHVDDILTVLRRENWLGLHPVGALTTTGDHSPLLTGNDLPVLGRTEDLVGVLGRGGVDAVVFAEGAFASGAEMRRAAWTLEELSTKMIVVPALSGVSGQRVSVRPVAGLPLLYVERPRAERASSAAKRAFDIFGSLVALVLFAIPLLVSAVVIKVHDRGPVLFRQQRVGRRGKPFWCFKLRTMVVDAEARFAGMRHLNEGASGLFKAKADPRITGPGATLRRYSLDELPQLLNVLRGDMSLVGPRPALPHEVAAYEADVTRRLRVKPGMTGLWQVSGRSDLSWEDTVRLDLYYVDNWSMLQDVQILIRTAKAVVAGSGAY